MFGNDNISNGVDVFCFIKIQIKSNQAQIKNNKNKGNRFKYLINCNLKISHNDSFKFWLFKNSLINTSGLTFNLNQAVSKSFLSCKNLNEKLNELEISQETLEINIKQHSKNFLIFDNGFGLDKNNILPFFKLISQPIPFKKKNLNSGKNNHLIPLKFSTFFGLKHLKIITKKLGRKKLIIFSVDFNTNRIFIFEIESDETDSFTFLNLNGNFKKHFFDPRVYIQFKKNLLFKPYWLNIKFYVLEKKTKKNMDEREKLKPTKNNTKIFLASSIKFIQKKDYLNLFEKLSFKWNYPLCMLHFSICPGKKIDVIIFIPRYFSPTFMTNDFSLFKNKKSYQYHYQNLNFSIEKLTPEWLTFGEGILKIKNGKTEKNFESLNRVNLENEIKKKISKKITELLSNFSLKNPNSYNFFWKAYNQELRSNIIKNKHFSINFFHLLRFSSSRSGDLFISLNDYILKMKRDQNEIYYYPAKNNILSKHQPDLEVLATRGIEVLFIFDTIDEVLVELLKKKQNDWNGKKIFFKRVGSFDYYDNFQKYTTAKFNSRWEPVLCLKWFSFEFSQKFLRVENSNILCSSSSNFVFSEDLLASQANCSSDRKIKIKKMDSLSSIEQNVMFDINGSNTLIRMLNKYLKTKKTKKTSKEVGLLILEITYMRCGILINNEKNFTKRIENFLIIFLLILYSKDTKETNI